MFIVKKLKSGVRAQIIVRYPTEKRLQSKCFRGTTLPLAGNFSRWDRVGELFSDRVVLEQFLDDMDYMWSKNDFATHSVIIVHSETIGWESTSALEGYADDDLERFDLNRKSWGLRVKLARTDLPAPLTKELTIVYEFKVENNRPTAIIHSIYPGYDVGELVGDVTENEKRVFFDWNHPGAT